MEKAEIKRYFSIADEVEQTVEKCLKEADRLRQSILKRAFEGKLVPQDPEDKPAEKLLERIKAEKAKLQAKPKIYGHQRANVNNKT
jgi:type I restriction enzyme S subunit